MLNQNLTNGTFSYITKESSLHCFSLKELIRQTKLIYKVDLLTILN